MSVATGILELSQHSNVVFGEGSQVGILGLPLVFTSAGMHACSETIQLSYSACPPPGSGRFSSPWHADVSG